MGKTKRYKEEYTREQHRCQEELNSSLPFGYKFIIVMQLNFLKTNSRIIVKLVHKIQLLEKKNKDNKLLENAFKLAIKQIK